MKKEIISCINCSQKLRIPTKYEKVKITCPSCSTSWELHNPNFKENFLNVAGILGVASGTVGSSMNFADNIVFNAERGHGFAAEKANHLHDSILGKDAKIVGDSNAKNGADRLVDGVYIQTKYCNTASKSVAEAFDQTGYKYLNHDGSPMSLEVPSDQYASAVKAMEERIKKGQVKNITDPEKAKDIVRKGKYTYAQARNIAKFGTIESITFDAVNGIKISGTAMGISAAISFAMHLWNGDDWEIALESACYDGLKTGGVVWLSSILTAQLGRTGIEQSLRGTTDWVVQQMGYKASALLANGLRNGSNIYGAASANYVSKVLRGNIATAAVTTVVLSSVDIKRLWDGRISSAQFCKNVTTTAMSVVGGTGGYMAGVAAGAAIGSVVPIAGTAVGAGVGFLCGMLGAFTFSSAASTATSAVLDNFIEDDAKEMLKILGQALNELFSEYLLIDKEKEIAINNIQAMDLPNLLRDMYAVSNRKSFAKEKIRSFIEDVAKARKKIKLPSNKDVITATGHLIDKIIVDEQPA
jgi:hypothetical protein